KCDEKPDADGQCQTCVRLRLQCLGFGAKRPEWMRVTMEPEFSMLEVMGCDNLTFLALAEISALAAWKDEETKHQTLSSVELVRRGFDIEGRYLQAISRTGSNTSQERSGAMADSLENRRRLTADIFRASARLYLHTVLSGDKPSVREIREGVSETLNALMRVPNDPKPLRRSVVRSVVFPICLAGCMTDDRTERDAFRKVLDCEGGAGNCTSVVEVMEIVWQRRDAAYNAQKRRSGRRPVEHVDDVNWRDVLKEHGGGVPILLV
ncbi:uncharacterized protein FOMMEDRAFT_76733, partial [Fomitiporia mediterranea MF3/22]|uniref:uncharacterized protein n=1 Tax=Fomitiporia mediterranea (strain MF3/22) TaxID=694068 RepID=UPI0004407384